MSILTNHFWNGEYLKCIIKFGDGTEYVTYNNNNLSNSNFIYKASFSLKDGNNSVNPLGINESSVLYLQVYDKNDYLSPLNTDSPYYGQMHHGVEIDMFISYDGSTWDDYGVWYVTNWSGSFNTGGHGIANITCEDRLNILGNMDIPKLPAYADVYSGSLIRSVLTSCGVANEDIIIDASCNVWMYYGVYNGKKVRDFLNNVCQVIEARIIVDRHNKIRVIPSLALKENYNEIDLNGSELGGLQNKVTRASEYNRIDIKYLNIIDKDRKELFRKKISFNSGFNRSDEIRFYSRALSVENIGFEGAGSENIGNIDFTAYQNGIVIDATCSSAVTDVTVFGYGIVADTKEEIISGDVRNTGGKTFTFNTNQMMSKDNASSLLSSIINYINNIKNQIAVNGTILTPKLDIGDLVVIDNTNSVYDGRYRVSNIDINFSSDYNVDCTLVRLEASND